MRETVVGIPERETRPSIDPRWSILTTDDGSHTLIDQASGDAMHSGCGALAETEHVYVANSGVLESLEQQRSQTILEIGLGTGLGVLATAQHAERTGTHIRYLALEINPPPSDVIRQLQFELLGIAPKLIADLTQVLDQLQPETTTGKIGSQCELTISVSDAAKWQPREPARYDAVYFDPFSPATNPELWTVPVFKQMHLALRDGGRLVSYCVNRQVRDSLTEAGFQLQKVAGPPNGKREVLIATKV